MDTTAVYVEQVIIGFFVIVTVIVLATGALPVIDKEHQSLVLGFALLAASYVVGILFDRCADSLLDPIARWFRISFAVYDAEVPLTTDPFPEYGKRLLSPSPTQMYMLSRLRILRAFTILLPAMTIAWCVYAKKDVSALVPTLLAYAAFVIIAARSNVPSTNELTALNEFLKRYGRVRDGKVRCDRWLLFLHPLVIALIAFAVYAAMQLDPAKVFAGLALTLLTGWAWLRVSGTHMQLVRELVRSERAQSERT